MLKDSSSYAPSGRPLESGGVGKRISMLILQLNVVADMAIAIETSIVGPKPVNPKEVPPNYPTNTLDGSTKKLQETLNELHQTLNRIYQETRSE